MNAYLPAAATFSKDPRAWGVDFKPSQLQYAHSTRNGERVVDTRGIEYIDWVSGLGAVILGHCHEEWAQAVRTVIGSGIGFSLPHLVERQAAHALANVVGAAIWPELGEIGIRFGKNGSDVTTAAIRLARAYTGRDQVVVINGGYHGWHEWFISSQKPARGCLPPPEGFTGPTKPKTDIHVGFQPNIVHVLDVTPDMSAEQLREHFRYGFPSPKPAAVIIEPPLNAPPQHYYDTLFECAAESGALVIMDEICTATRFAAGGDSELYSLTPDLVCLGKPLGNGLPISALLGRTELMREFDYGDPVFVSGTHLGERVSLQALLSTLRILERDNVRSHIQSVGAALCTELTTAIILHKFDAVIAVEGRPERSLVTFTGEHANKLRGAFIRGMADRGVLMNRPNYPNYGHTIKDVTDTANAFNQVLDYLTRTDWDDLPEGPQPLFTNR